MYSNLFRRVYHNKSFFFSEPMPWGLNRKGRQLWREQEKYWQDSSCSPLTSSWRRGKAAGLGGGREREGGGDLFCCLLFTLVRLLFCFCCRMLFRSVCRKEWYNLTWLKRECFFKVGWFMIYFEKMLFKLRFKLCCVMRLGLGEYWSLGCLVCVVALRHKNWTFFYKPKYIWVGYTFGERGVFLMGEGDGVG